MKKFSLIMCAIAMMGVCFTSCKKEQNTPIDNIVENGFYVLGPATGYADLQTKGVAVCQLAPGTNEATKEARVGMYEKYIVLEANKEFFFVHKAGDKTINYTAPIEKKELVADGQNPEGYFGLLAEGATAMKVAETGLYHIVLDLNEDKLLDAAGGKQVIIAPVSWGISGGMNGWGMTVGEKAADAYTWTWKGMEIPAGTEFKFKDEHGWKIFLDGETTQVSTETNLGAGLVPGAANIKVEEGGVYDITLSYSLAKGAIADSYKHEIKKTGELVLDPATFVVGISGSMNDWGDPAGVTLAKYDAASSQVDAATKVGTYVYKMEGVSFPAESTFKFRYNGAWIGFGGVEVSGVNAVEAEKDQNYTGVEGAYDIVITVAWDGNQATSIKADFTEGIPVDYIEDYFYLLNEGTLTDINIYGWAPNKDNNNEIFGAWPGTRVNGDATSLTRVFFEKAIMGGEYKFIVNGTGGQTSDPDWVVSFDDPNVHHTLKVTADNKLIVVE